MKSIDVVLIAQQENISPKVDNQYHQNITQESQILQTVLEEKGLSVKRVGWDDPDFDWSSARCGIIRETWDYFHRIGEFRDWLEGVKSQTQLINPFDQLIWNMDKHYLHDLSEKGVNIPDTLFIEKGDHRSLNELHEETYWEKTVLKPAISGGGRHTYLLDKENRDSHEDMYRKLIGQEAMLLQRFQENVVKYGEWTFVLIGGKYTHGILKKAKLGDFRVQDDFGGTVHDHQATPEEIAYAEKVMSLIDPLPLYGRVDVILDQHGEMAVQEVELIEPELWFRNCPLAAELLADQIAAYLNR